jgi:hypothetical protein
LNYGRDAVPLLHDIQAELLDTDRPIAPSLLKLQFLSLRLGSVGLQRWVKYEMDGYPEKVRVPDYRVTTVGYSGTFNNGHWHYPDIAVPSVVIAQLAGIGWVDYPIRESIAVIDAIVSDKKPDSQYAVNTGNIRERVGNKIFKGMQCLDLRGTFSVGAFIHIQHAVRARTLETAIKLEMAVPLAAEIVVGINPVVTADDQVKMNQIINQTIYGNVGNINNAVKVNGINVLVNQGEPEDLTRVLIANGVTPEAAAELVAIVQEEELEDDKTFGKRATAWIADKIEKGGGLVAKASVDVAKAVATEAIKQYLGLT